jgi:hypothetical protein
MPVGPTKNYVKIPTSFIYDLAPGMSSPALRLLLYVARHTWGFQDEEKRITIDEFMHGRKRVDETRIDKGAGVSKPSVLNGIRELVELGVLSIRVDARDGGRVKRFFRINLDESGDNKSDPEDKTGGNEIDRDGKISVKSKSPVVKSDDRVNGYCTPRGNQIYHPSEKETLIERNQEKKTRELRSHCDRLPFHSYEDNRNNVLKKASKESPRSISNKSTEEEEMPPVSNNGQFNLEKTKQEDLPQESEAMRLAIKLKECLIKQRSLMRHPNIKDWEKELQAVIDLGYTPDEISDLINWYTDNLNKEFVPQAFSAKSFRDKYPSITKAKHRIEMLPENDRARFIKLIEKKQKEKAENEKRRASQNGIAEKIFRSVQ